MKSKLAALRAQRGGGRRRSWRVDWKVSRQTVNAIETERYETSFFSLAFTIATLFDRPIEAVFRPTARR